MHFHQWWFWSTALNFHLWALFSYSVKKTQKKIVNYNIWYVKVKLDSPELAHAHISHWYDDIIILGCALLLCKYSHPSLTLVETKEGPQKKHSGNHVFLSLFNTSNMVYEIITAEVPTWFSKVMSRPFWKQI